MKIRVSLLAFGAVALGSTTAHAQQLLNSDFSTYANGNLVGQNGWTQFATSATVPLQVVNGQVVIPALAAGISADNQDAAHLINTFTAPTTAGVTQSLYVGLNLNVSFASSAASPSYFLGFVDTSSASNFVNGRLTAKDNGNGTFVFGSRVTGQSNSPYVFGTSGINYNTTNQLIERINLVGGGADSVDLFVNPTSADLSTLTPYSSSPIAGGSPPVQLGQVVISQFSNAGTAGQTGVNISSLRVGLSSADVFVANTTAAPEASTIVLMGGGVILGGLLLSRRRKA